MRKSLFLCTLLLLSMLLFGCQGNTVAAEIAATTLPVYEFTTILCQGTDIQVARIVTEDVACLHDYTLQVSQMRIMEAAQVVVQSGAGLEDFLDLTSAQNRIDASEGIPLLESSCHHHEGHENHQHETDAHIWLCPANAKIMAQNICDGLCQQFPEHTSIFQDNLTGLLAQLDTLESYGNEALAQLTTRELITFHDGFGYFADSFQLTILKAVEEESGSEASAAELIELIELVEQHHLPAIFTERSGSTSAASILAAETGASIFTLDMAMAGNSYFDAMYHNIDTIKEALG